MIDTFRFVTALAVALCSAAALAQTPAVRAPAPMAPDTVLADNGIARITRADYDLELTRLPPEVRGGFATSEKRVVELINRLLVTRTLAAQADAAKLADDPETARRISAELVRVKSQLMLAKIERDAQARFDANPAPYEARARDLYAVDPKRFESPDEVSASHILFAIPPHTPEEAMRVARETRAAIVGGANFETIARERSQDSSAKTNSGKLGFFGRGQMDPQFEQAAFALTTVGAISEPVASSFGVHLIRLDARKASQRQTFDQAKPRIMAEQRAQYVGAERDAELDRLRIEAVKGTDMAKVDAMVIRVDGARMDKLQRDALQSEQERLRQRSRQPPAPK